MLVLIVSYTVMAGKEEQAREFVRRMQEHTRTEPGCRFYAGQQSLDNPQKFCFYEQYDDQAALDAHRSQPYFAQYITNGLATIIEPGTRKQELFTTVG
ncbi:MAG TPA: putative quinol monooxygenase [Terriglobales bacterium]|nr:putative quinol monooxygenase [Terriglobales bacterium]